MAKKTLRTLSDKDIDLLQWVIDEARSLRGRALSRTPVDFLRDMDADQQAPELYIAKPQEGSIPAMTPAETTTGTGTGTETASPEYDTPGEAYCDIYKITEDNDGNPAIIQVNREVRVFNVAASVIDPGNGYLVVNRDKFGRWLAGASPGLALRWFCLTADLEQGSQNTATALDVDSQEMITVYDPHGEFYGTAGESGGIAYQHPNDEVGKLRIIRELCPGFQSEMCSGITGTGTY